MSKKPEKWDVKLWILVDSITKYVFDFEVYYGKKGIGVGTMRANWIGIPSTLADTPQTHRVDQGHLKWSMHSSQGISSVMSKDKCLLLLSSTHVLPLGLLSLHPPPKVLHKSGAVHHQIPTSPIVVKYTTYMCGVDVVDQLRSSYSA